MLEQWDQAIFDVRAIAGPDGSGSGRIYRDDFNLTFGDSGSFSQLRRVTSVPAVGGQEVTDTFVQASGTRASGAFTFGHVVQLTDRSIVATTVKTVTGAANNGSGLIRVTCAGHGFSTGDWIGVYGVVGTTEANGAWQATVINANTFDLQGSTFTNAYVSGGKATNRAGMYGNFVTVFPSQSRGGLTGTAANADDVVGYGVYNGSANNSTATLGYNVNNNPSFTGDQWYQGFSVEANVTTAFSVSGNCSQYGLDFLGIAASPIPTYGLGAIRLPNAVFVTGRNAANNADLNMFRLNSGNQLEVDVPSLFSGEVFLFDGINMTFPGSTGNKIGTATTQKIGFWNATPVVQPSTTGTATGFTAGAGTTVTHLSTFTGNTGSAAYTIGDVVNALKKIGVMAS